MKIEKILKQLTPERIKKEIETIQRIKLPQELQRWVKQYEKVGERKDFFWKFIYISHNSTDPFRITNVYEKSIIDTKFLMTMFIVLVDDIVDKIKNKYLLNELLNIIAEKKKIKFYTLNQKEKKYLQFAKKLWRYIETKIKKYPKYEEFREIFYYDVEQVLNAMKYSYLINKHPYLVNKTENWLYSPNTSQGMVNGTLDLMCIHKVNFKEIGKIREVFWKAQKMARIANCLATWKREFKERDFTSSVFVYAVELDLLNIKDLKKENSKNIIKKIEHSVIKKKLLKEWEKCHAEIKYLCRTIESISFEEFLPKLEKLLLVYLVIKNYGTES